MSETEEFLEPKAFLDKWEQNRWEEDIADRWIQAKLKRDAETMEKIITEYEVKEFLIDAAEREHELAALKEYWYGEDVG